MKFVLWICLYLPGMAMDVSAQTSEKDTSYSDLETVVVSFNQWEQKRNEVPNRILKVDLREVILRNPQTAADMLGQSAGVFIQKSQQAGGSPMIRGFAANRVLIVSDGVRMNNAIFRSGNLQNIISIDPQIVENAEVILGPGTILYGSDAIGGVMDFHTLTPRFSSNDSLFVNGQGMLRHATANREKTIHTHLNLGGKKWSWLGSFSHSDFDDLRMGRNGGQDRYLRLRYVSVINGRDSVVTNHHPHIQRFTGYRQTNMLQKIRFRPNQFHDLQYGYTLANTGEAPRYDRLLQNRQGLPRFAEWNYTPMVWQMHRFQWLHLKETRLYDRSRIIIALQDYKEGRYDRSLNSSMRNRSNEHLIGWHVHWDNLKKLPKGALHYGFEWVLDRVHSIANTENLQSGIQRPQQSRYPDGSSAMNSALYLSHKYAIREKVFISSGVRINHGLLQSRFDTVFFRFPFKNVRLSAVNLTGNLGMSVITGSSGSIHANLSTGFRMPNIDDLGKTFESTPGRLTVPNPELKPEYAYHAALGFEQMLSENISLEGGVFHTWLVDAIVRRPSTFKGADSIDFLGSRLAVEALRNAALARVWGGELTATVQILPGMTLKTGGVWTKGWETDDAADLKVPLRHAPPIQGFCAVKYAYKGLRAELVWNANGSIHADDMPPTEIAKPDIYALDARGHPYSPGWHTLDIRCAYSFDRGPAITIGCENITDQRYRSYSSGMVAAGRNFIVSLRYGF
jgi:hemoglobin/transferrin/lactoferrin receptor protein